MLELLMRNLPQFKGKHFISKLLLKKKIERAADISIEGKFGCNYLLPNLKEHVTFELYVNGIHEQETHDFILSKLSKGAVFLDLGANIGAISIPLAKRRSDIKVICVEAAPWIFNYLAENVKNNSLEKQVRIFNFALFEEDGLKLPFYSPKDKFGSGSLSSVFTDEAIEVTTITVDTLLKEEGISNVDFIKIDIEGYEYFAFKSAKKLLESKHAPDIFFEFVDWAEDLAKGVKKGDAQKLLKEWGYRLFSIENGKQRQLTEIVVDGALMIYATKNYS